LLVHTTLYALFLPSPLSPHPFPDSVRFFITPTQSLFCTLTLAFSSSSPYDVRFRPPPGEYSKFYTRMKRLFSPFSAIRCLSTFFSQPDPRRKRVLNVRPPALMCFPVWFFKAQQSGFSLDSCPTSFAFSFSCCIRFFLRTALMREKALIAMQYSPNSFWDFSSSYLLYTRAPFPLTCLLQRPFVLNTPCISETNPSFSTFHPLRNSL